VRVSSVDYAGNQWILASARDITERKKAEEEIRQLNEKLEDRVERRTVQLRDSEERYRLVVSGANDGIWDWDIRTGEVYWSQRFSEMLDLSHSEVEPSFDLFVELIHPDDRQRVLDAITAHLERNVEYSEEFRARHSSGEYIYVMARGRALRDEDGTPIRMAGSVSDITERKKNEVAQRFLAEASAELASSLDYHTTLTSMAKLAVPHLADWCLVDVTEEYGSIRRLTVYHEDPEKVALAHELQERYAPPGRSLRIAQRVTHGRAGDDGGDTGVALGGTHPRCGTPRVDTRAGPQVLHDRAAHGPRTYPQRDHVRDGGLGAALRFRRSGVG
jgi:PAS domain S-box-containing protein